MTEINQYLSDPVVVVDVDAIMAEINGGAAAIGGKKGGIPERPSDEHELHWVCGAGCDYDYTAEDDNPHGTRSYNNVGASGYYYGPSDEDMVILDRDGNYNLNNEFEENDTDWENSELDSEWVSCPKCGAEEELIGGRVSPDFLKPEWVGPDDERHSGYYDS